MCEISHVSSKLHVSNCLTGCTDIGEDFHGGDPSFVIYSSAFSIIKGHILAH